MGCVGGKPKNEDAIKRPPSEKYQDQATAHPQKDFPAQSHAALPKESEASPLKGGLSDGNTLNYHPPQQHPQQPAHPSSLDQQHPQHPQQPH